MEQFGATFPLIFSRFEVFLGCSSCSGLLTLKSTGKKQKKTVFFVRNLPKIFKFFLYKILSLLTFIVEKIASLSSPLPVPKKIRKIISIMLRYTKKHSKFQFESKILRQCKTNLEQPATIFKNLIKKKIKGE